jgi:hypothetical protein
MSNLIFWTAAAVDVGPRSELYPSSKKTCGIVNQNQEQMSDRHPSLATQNKR